MERIYKYPRTPHIIGSNIQKGDENLNKINIDKLRNKYIVIEEKVDGANCGISFDRSGKIYLQSRGHFLNGGYGEKQFHLFKAWANTHKATLYKILGNRYIMYGEWLYAKHTVFYDELTHYFMEFDIYDKVDKKFLSTKRRKQLLKDYKFIVSVLVLFDGKINKFEDIKKHLGKSNFKSEYSLDNLEKICNELNLSFEVACKQTDKSMLMEGLYIKVENENEVLERCKYVRDSFINTIIDSETHWINRPIIPNRLKSDINIFSQEGDL